MSQSPTTSAAKPDVTQDAEPTVGDGTSHAPVLITEQEVVFGTAAAASSRPASTSRRLIDAIRGFGAALNRPPAATALPEGKQLPRALPDGPRNGSTVNTLPHVLGLLSLMVFGVGMHNLQLRLERWDRERHFND